MCPISKEAETLAMLGVDEGNENIGKSLCGVSAYAPRIAAVGSGGI